MARDTPEGKVKKAIKAYLNALGAFHRWPVSNGMGGDQVDCYGCHCGLYFAFEVKRDDLPKVPEATERQKRHLKEVREAGGIAAVVSSVDEVKLAFYDADLPI